VPRGLGTCGFGPLSPRNKVPGFLARSLNVLCVGPFPCTCLLYFVSTCFVNAFCASHVVEFVETRYICADRNFRSVSTRTSGRHIGSVFVWLHVSVHLLHSSVMSKTFSGFALGIAVCLVI
jgi:hypothetical protein